MRITRRGNKWVVGDLMVANGHLTIDQGPLDDAAFIVRSSDIAHGMTSLAPTDVYFNFAKSVAASGGVDIVGYTEDTIGLSFVARVTNGNTTKTTSAAGAFQLQGAKKTGTTVGAMGANENVMVVYDGSSARLIFDSDGDMHINGRAVNDKIGNGTWYLNDDSNAKSTMGATFNQAGNDDHVVSLKSSDVAHGITNQAETDTYGSLSKTDAAAGGLAVMGLSETIEALTLEGFATTESTTKTTSAGAAVRIEGYKKSGTGLAAMSADANILVISSNLVARFVFDNDGDLTLTGGKITWGGNGTGAAGSIYKEAAGGLSLWGVTGSSYDIIAFNNAGNAYWAGLTGGTKFEFFNTVYINDTANARMTTGLTINQGAADDQILAMRSSDVAHGMTTLATTDTYGTFTKVISTLGGFALTGFSAGGTVYAAFIRGIAGSSDTAKSTAAVAPTMVDAQLKNGTGSTSVGADGNLFVVTNANSAKFIVDAEGEVHADATGGVANSGTGYYSFDEYDDAHLVRALEVERGAPGLVHSVFDGFLKYNRGHLEAARIATFNDGPDGDGSIFVNYTALSRLHSGAIWQMFTRAEEQDARIAALESQLLALTGEA